MLPVDMTGLVEDALMGDRRPPDGKLHPSGDLLGSLRHAQLRLVNAPTYKEDLVSAIRLRTGTMWHDYLHACLVKSRVPVMTEIDVTPGMPDGWTGTADWLFWSQPHSAFVLGDLKTIRGEGLRWIVKDGAKEEHLWQLSSYYWALVNMGYPMVEGFAVMYLPMNPDPENPVSIRIEECAPLNRARVETHMKHRARLASLYVDAFGEAVWDGSSSPFLNEYLAEEMPRVQKVYWNGKQGVFDVKLTPHWTTRYCPYPDDLCACNTQGIEKIGHYDTSGNYQPRKGYEGTAPTVTVPEKDLNRRRKELSVNFPS